MFPIDLMVSETRLANRTLFTGIIRDLTERKQAEEELKTLADNLERSNQELEEFASVASHDLQEPLRKVRAFGDLLKSEYGDVLADEGQDYLRRMLIAAERMQTLIDDLLSLSRITSKGEPFEPVDLNIVVQEVSEDLEVALEEAGANIIVSPLPTIDADPIQLRRLLQNLISNSLKFHNIEETPVVNIYSESIITPNGHNGHNGQNAIGSSFIRLIVEDNGIGFDAKYADRIFNIFQRLHSRQKYAGTGIGLAICRKIVERHGGQIVATSNPGEGAAFIITLPVAHKAGEKPIWKEMVTADP